MCRGRRRRHAQKWSAKNAPPVPMHVPMTLLGIRKSSTGAASGRRRSRQGTAPNVDGLGPAIAQDDERASRSIRAAYNDLLASDGSPSQITKTALLRQARLDRALTRLRRFPKTLKLIEECIETPEYFRRRLRWGLRELQRDGVPISRQRLIAMGCFTTRYAYLFEEVLSSFPDAVLDPRSIKAA